MPTKTPWLLVLLVTWVSITAVFPTLVVYRAAFQPEYQWGLFGITGVGMSPGFALVAAAAGWAWALVVLGQRQPARTFATMLVGWNAFLLLSLTLGALRWGDDMVLRGDALNLRLNIALAGPLVVFGMLLASVLWLRRVWHEQQPLLGPMPRLQRRIVVTAIALAPLIALLFFLGHGVDHTSQDRVAVILVIVQCVTISVALGATPGSDTSPA